MMDMQIKDALKQRDKYRKLSEDKDAQIKELKFRLDNNAAGTDLSKSTPNAVDDILQNSEEHNQVTENMLECISILTRFRQGLSERYQITQENMAEVDNLIT